MILILGDMNARVGRAKDSWPGIIGGLGGVWRGADLHDNQHIGDGAALCLGAGWVYVVMTVPVVMSNLTLNYYSTDSIE